MFSCPYCRTELTETTASCPKCQLSLSTMTRAMGPTPMLSPGVTDFTGALAKRDRQTATRALRLFETQFEDSHFHVVVRDFDEKFSLATSLFWLFNLGGLAPVEQSLGKNRDLMLGIDPTRGRAALIVGYGLEPYVTPQQLNQLLEGVRPLLRESKYGLAIRDLIASSITLLKESSVSRQ